MTLKRGRQTSPAPGEGVDTAHRTWAIEYMSFDGVDQSTEAHAPTHHYGGDDGITISAWVKRSRNDYANDRVVDFGNGMNEENIVINFGYNMTCALR